MLCVYDNPCWDKSSDQDQGRHVHSGTDSALQLHFPANLPHNKPHHDKRVHIQKVNPWTQFCDKLSFKT